MSQNDLCKIVVVFGFQDAVRASIFLCDVDLTQVCLSGISPISHRKGLVFYESMNSQSVEGGFGGLWCGLWMQALEQDLEDALTM